MARLVTAMGALFTSFDQCMFGAESVKPTVLLASPAAHDAVRSRFGNVKCTHGDGAHNVLTGETNGVYNTAAAAAYTPELNATLAATFMAVAPAPATRAKRVPEDSLPDWDGKRAPSVTGRTAV